ncbi:MAG: hypothetical protein GY865_17820, partial [candidate division Zixibacteria bacterium]|nr:hypothetical protein [candidate division Zixibacteria bacterium]
MKLRILSITIIMALILLIGCGAETKKETLSSSQYLPEKTVRSDLVRFSEIRTFPGESLWEYINGGAEVYHLYKFIEVTTADYKNDQIELVADIYHFDGEENSFGLYSMLCPAGAKIINLGVEGFLSPASVNFVKGEYLIRLTGFEDTNESELALINLAEELNEIIPGTTERPKQFGLFPNENKVSGLDKYFAEQFMGQKFLSGVFSRNVVLDSDTVTLFVSSDVSGGKFLSWSNYSEKINKKKDRPENIPFDDTLCLVIEDNYYGDIIVGL